MLDYALRNEASAKGAGGADQLLSGRVGERMPESIGPRPWDEVHIWSMEAHDHNHVIEALLTHMNCSLQRRWNPDKGVEWRFEPKP